MTSLCHHTIFDTQTVLTGLHCFESKSKRQAQLEISPTIMLYFGNFDYIDVFCLLTTGKKAALMILKGDRR